ncbi:MAG: VOC family protein [Hyphomicrobiales bacterium]|nr:VOC family protein [Hyphomicrobiales bacterium]
MPVTGLNHFSIRTADLARSVAFYAAALDLRDGARPPFDFPGNWLYCGEVPVIHLIGVDGADAPGADTGAVDHLAFTAAGYDATLARLRDAGIPFRERVIPGRTLRQIFVEDPDGVAIELNFAGE